MIKPVRSLGWRAQGVTESPGDSHLADDCHLTKVSSTLASVEHKHAIQQGKIASEVSRITSEVSKIAGEASKIAGEVSRTASEARKIEGEVMKMSSTGGKSA
jgi:hypothetical protein